MQRRCWTADRLRKRGLPHHEACPFCDQEDESIDHLLVGCVFARQLWHTLLQRIGQVSLTPQPSEVVFDDWWRRVTEMVGGHLKKGLNSYITLGAWSLWRHRNDCMFNGASPRLATISTMVGNKVSTGAWLVLLIYPY